MEWFASIRLGYIDLVKSLVTFRRFSSLIHGLMRLRLLVSRFSRTTSFKELRSSDSSGDNFAPSIYDQPKAWSCSNAGSSTLFSSL